MKKILAIIAVLILSIPTAFACETPVLPNNETAGFEESGSAWVVLSAEDRLLCGKLTPNEKLDIIPFKTVTNLYVRGIYENSVIREKAEMQYSEIEDIVFGLTKVEVSVSIDNEYESAVDRIVCQRISETAEMTSANIIACTIGVTEKTIYHYLFGSTANYIIVGSVIFNGKDEVDLCMGDWNNDGLVDLGFPVYIGKPEEKKAEPEIITNTIYVKETVVKEVVKENTCVKIVQINNQVNINSTVTNTQKIIINNNKKGGCAMRCISEQN